jgi:acyl-CoA hydrolase
VTTATCVALTEALADRMTIAAQRVASRRVLTHFVRFIAFNPVSLSH